jgi:tetratricopeptide (TPR) repeat protein
VIGLLVGVFCTGVLVVAAWTVLTWRQIPVWHDGITLFTRAIDVTHDNFVARVGLGVALARSGDMPGALRSLREALRINPGNAEAKYDLELIKRTTGGAKRRN